MEKPERFISVDAAAKMLGVNDSRVRQLLRADELRGFKVSERSWIVDRKSVEKRMSEKNSCKTA